MSEYKLIKAIGLAPDVHRAWYDKEYGFGEGSVRAWVLADDLERALEKAPVIGLFPYSDCPREFSGSTSSQVMKEAQYTHAARLVCIEPIKKETADDILRELIKMPDGTGDQFTRWEALIDRARKLLDGK